MTVIAMVRVRIGGAVSGMIGRAESHHACRNSPCSSIITGTLACGHQLRIVGGDHHRGAEAVEFLKETQKPLRQRRIDIARRLVGEQQIRLGDDGPGDRGALLLAAGQNRRIHVRLARAGPPSRAAP